jgi:hypothetical protein
MGFVLLWWIVQLGQKRAELAVPISLGCVDNATH